MEKILVKIPLQFFGEPEDFDDGDENLDDDFFDEDDGYYDDDPDDDEDQDGDGSSDDGDSDDGSDDETADGNGEEPAQKGAETPAEGTNAESELISELKALGYVGNDIASLAADMKAKRESKAATDASKERKAVNAAGKSHIKSSSPGKGASGDGTGGVTERQVISFAERAGCSKEEARRVLAKHARMMSN